MTHKITLEDLIRIFGEDFIPAEIDRKILMKHFDVGINRVIGDKSVDKVKKILLSSIETARIEQFKDRGGVISSPVARLTPEVTAKVEGLQTKDKESQQTDKYGLSSIRQGMVSKRLQAKDSQLKEDKSKYKEEQFKSKEDALSSTTKSDKNIDSILPTVEDLTLLSGGQMKREDPESEQSNGIGHVQREISIRNFKVQNERRSVRWGKDKIKNRKGKFQEINHPAYIFHSDLKQIEEARTTIIDNRCDILQHCILDMIANSINVVMLENEEEPFFVVEGFGILHSKGTLKDKIQFQELIQLMIISCEVWEIALRRPESLIKGKDAIDKMRTHSVDMTSVIPLAGIRNKIIDLDDQFKAYSHQPDQVLIKTLQELQNHRKNIVWKCGKQTIDNLRRAVKEHRYLIENPAQSLNIVVLGAKQAYHPMKVKFNLSGTISFYELFPDYCEKHQNLSDISLRNIFGSIPAIYDTKGTESWKSELPKIAHAVYQRLGFSAIENQFDPGYIKGSSNNILPIGNLDLILPLTEKELEEKLLDKGFLF